MIGIVEDGKKKMFLIWHLYFILATGRVPMLIRLFGSLINP